MPTIQCSTFVNTGSTAYARPFSFQYSFSTVALSTTASVFSSHELGIRNISLVLHFTHIDLSGEGQAVQINITVLIGRHLVNRFLVAVINQEAVFPPLHSERGTDRPVPGQRMPGQQRRSCLTASKGHGHLSVCHAPASLYNSLLSHPSVRHSAIWSWPPPLPESRYTPAGRPLEPVQHLSAHVEILNRPLKGKAFVNQNFLCSSTRATISKKPAAYRGRLAPLG